MAIDRLALVNAADQQGIDRGQTLLPDEIGFLSDVGKREEELHSGASGQQERIPRRADIALADADRCDAVALEILKIGEQLPGISFSNRPDFGPTRIARADRAVFAE